MPAPDPREIAEQVIRRQAREEKRGTITAVISEMTDQPLSTRRELTALCDEVGNLISQATVTVTWPEADDDPPYDAEANICVGCPGCHTGSRCIDDPADPDDDPESEADNA